jgi:iron complex transport system substrate-binding protein
MIEDAGGAYSWSDLNSSGSVELSLEAVMDRNAGTDFWIGPGDYTTKADLLQADPRYAHFQAFQMDQVYNSHGRIGSAGGFEYFELAGARPDLVLGDLISIFHPEYLPDHELYFYQKLD